MISPIRIQIDDISIHALRVEGDLMIAAAKEKPRPFISIHALRVEGDRRFCYAGGGRKDISIHALRVEGDTSVLPEVELKP